VASNGRGDFFRGPPVWVVEATHPVCDGWEQVEADLYHRAGRRWDDGVSGGRTRVLKWFVETLEAARGLRDALKKVPGVSVVARDPINGR
jgi:hypothetical protein